MGILLGYCLPRFGVPLDSSQTHNSLSQITATLLIAYSIEMGAVVRNSTRLEQREESEQGTWVGFVFGVGMAGLVAVFAAIACAQHAVTSDSFSTSWDMLAGVALGGTIMLGALVVALPVLWLERIKQLPR